MQKFPNFLHFFSSNCCKFVIVEFECLFYHKRFIFYPKKMKTSSIKETLRHCREGETLQKCEVMGEQASRGILYGRI